MNLWCVMIAAGILTYAMRLSFILLVGEKDFPHPLKRALRFVPSTVLTAIIIPEILYNSNGFDLSITNFRLIAGGMAFFIAWRTRNSLLTIIVGMFALWIMQYLENLLT